MVKRPEDFGLEGYQLSKYRGKEIELFDFVHKNRSPMPKAKKESYIDWEAKRK